MKTNLTRAASLLAFSALFGSSALQAQQFVNEIPIPPAMTGPNYLISIESGSHNFDPNGFITTFNLNVPLATYCYNEQGSSAMSYLGPTLVINEGDSAHFEIENNLPNLDSTTVHWHGLNIPAEMDGGPHQVIENGDTWQPKFRMIDLPQTAWYHTHLMGRTTDQVILGLAGMLLVKDPTAPIESQLPNDYGFNDFPIIIQEKGFLLDTFTNTATAIKAGEHPGNGPQTLVNGVVGGYLRVPPEMVRLRILNGSPRKQFNIGLSTQLNDPTNFAQMHMIATGGGYLPNPIIVDSTMISVGDRREFMIDFSLYANGDTVYLSNLDVPLGANYGTTDGEALMAFIVWDSIFPPNPIVTVPASINPSYALAPGPIFQSREKHLNGQGGMTPGGGGGQGPWLIDSTGMDMMVINDTVLVNTKESWKIVNNTNKSHPFHIHKVQFQVTEYHGKYGAGNDSMDFTFANLPPEMVGFKDVQMVREHATMTFVARFDSFPSLFQPNMGYMYHCHILTHEDMDMMHQFVVIDSLDFYTAMISMPETEKLIAYPNPATNSVAFTGDYQDQGMLRIYDLTGRFIREYEINGNLTDYTINVQEVPRGMFVLEYTSGQKRYVQKISLQ
jgi:bilirubin oxidase